MLLPDLESIPEARRGELIEVLERSYRSFRFFSRYWFNFDPHPKQRLLAAPGPRRTFVSCGSGFGKSFAFALILMWEAFKNERCRYAAIAPTHLQAGLIVRAMKDLITRGDGKFQPFIRRWPTKDDPHVEFENDTSILVFHTARGAEFLRGFEFNGAIMDEAAMDKDAAYQLLRTRIRKRPGWLRVGSTPKGKNWFFREAMLARAEMERALAEGREPTMRFIEGSSWDNPHYPREILEDLRDTMPRKWYEQEILGMFVDAEGASYKQEDLDRVFDATWEPELEPRRGALYSHGWDLGKKTTYSVGTTLAFDRISGVEGAMRGIGFEEHIGERWTTVFHHINERERYWGKGATSSSTAIDGTGLGDVVNDSLQIMPEAVIFTGPWRSEMTLRLQTLVEKPGMLRLPRSWTRLYSAMQLHTPKEDASGETWDHYDSMGLAAYEAMRLSSGDVGFFRM